MWVIEPSYAIKRGNGQQTGGIHFASLKSSQPVRTLAWLGLIATKVPRKRLTVTFIRTLFVLLYVTGDNAAQATSDAVDNTSTSESITVQVRLPVIFIVATRILKFS